MRLSVLRAVISAIILFLVHNFHRLRLGIYVNCVHGDTKYVASTLFPVRYPSPRSTAVCVIRFVLYLTWKNCFLIDFFSLQFSPDRIPPPSRIVWNSISSKASVQRQLIAQWQIICSEKSINFYQYLKLKNIFISPFFTRAFMLSQHCLSLQQFIKKFSFYLFYFPHRARISSELKSCTHKFFVQLTVRFQQPEFVNNLERGVRESERNEMKWFRKLFHVENIKFISIPRLLLLWAAIGFLGLLKTI